MTDLEMLKLYRRQAQDNMRRQGTHVDQRRVLRDYIADIDERIERLEREEA